MARQIIPKLQLCNKAILYQVLPIQTVATTSAGVKAASSATNDSDWTPEKRFRNIE